MNASNLVLGVDVAEAAKGLDLVAIDESLRPVWFRRAASIDDVLQAVDDLQPALIAIDSPPEWAAVGRSRPIERDLRRLGINAYSTPAAEFAGRFHRWMESGFAVFAAVAAGYPLFRGVGDVRHTAIEVFPHASAVCLRGSVPPRRAPKSGWRRKALADAGVDVEPLNSADQLDACLAALTGLRALQGEASWVGVPGETVLALPIAKLPERAYPRDAAAPPAPRPVTWAAFEQHAPDFAARARAMLAARKHLTMATLRKDGGPRISGTEIQFRAGELVVGSMPRSVKGADLLRDGRVAIHGPTTDPPDGAPAAWPGEAKVAGLAHRLPDEAEALFFAIRVHEVVVTHLNQAGDRLVVESWTAERGYRSFERE